MEKVYCENCGIQVPQSAFVLIKTEKEIEFNDDNSVSVKETPIEPYYSIDEDYICSCGFHPEASTDWGNKIWLPDDDGEIEEPTHERYETKFCKSCGSSVNDDDYSNNHIIDEVDMESGEIFSFCKTTNTRINYL